MLNKTALITLLISITISSVSFAKEVAGIDLDQIDWESVCLDMEPIALKTPSISCEISHPASPWHDYRVTKYGVDKYPDVITCAYLEEELERFKTPSATPGKEWQQCSLLI